jgi:hypothetical protein
MSTDKSSAQLEASASFQDIGQWKVHKGFKKDEMFDEQFVDFMKWLRKDIHSKYTTEDFRAMERRNVTSLIVGYVCLGATYLALHNFLPQYALVWGVPMFLGAIYFCIKAEVMHMRAHSPANLTGPKTLDSFIDYTGLAFTGVSPTVLRRRHLAAHYNDVGSVSKLFSKVWFTFDKVPIIYYLRPLKLLRFIADKKWCETENINRRMLMWETLGFYIYLVALPVELFYFNSYFLLMFHLIPGLVVASTQIIGAIVCHSGLDAPNTFESCGLIDPKKIKGLFKVSIWWFSFFNANFFVNHSIHHAYPQAPLDLLNTNYERYYDHILKNYKNVRYNTVLQHHIHGELLSRMPEPNAFDYVVQFGITLFMHFFFILIAVGMPLPPVMFELLMVDYRIYFTSTRYERNVNKVRFMESINLHQAFLEQEEPNLYMKFFHWRYLNLKSWVANYERKHATVA